MDDKDPTTVNLNPLGGVAVESCRDYDDAAMRRRMDHAEVAVVNGSPVEVRAAADLASGRLGPWVAQAEKDRQASLVRKSPAAALRGVAGLFVGRDRRLLQGRADFDTPIRTCRRHSRPISLGLLQRSSSRGRWTPFHQPVEHNAGDLAAAVVRVRTIRYRGCKHETVAQVGYAAQAEAAALEAIATIEGLER